MRVFMWLIGCGLILTLAMIMPVRSHAACRVTGSTSGGGDIIVCDGTETNGIASAGGSDIITITTGANVGAVDQQTVATTAAASAVTVNTGDGVNTVNNFGSIAATVAATAQPAGKSASQATSGATAVKSGDGLDTLLNAAGISATATSLATADSISLTLTNSNSSTNTTQAETTSVGIDGGTGQNQVTNTGSVTVNATSTSTAPAITISATDTAQANVGVIAETNGIGITGTGSLTNLTPGSVTVTVLSEAKSGAVKAAVAGSATADASVNAVAGATGLAGGTTNETITAEGTITIDATANAEGSIDLESSVPNVAIDASIKADATASGINGGGGDDTINSSSTVTVTATTTSTTDNTGASFWAPGVTDAVAAANSLATGIAGGGGIDFITNTGNINSTAHTTTEPSVFLGSFGIELAKTVGTGNGGTSNSVSRGIDGGDDADTITNNGKINAITTATTTSSYVMLTEAGLGMFYIPVNAVCQSIGMDGGNGADTITNNSTVISTATSTASSVNVSISGLQLDIYSDGDARIGATSAATGISGGGGDDTITNTGTITATGAGTASSTRIGFAAIGSSRVTADVTAHTTATGIAGGSGNDQITHATGGTMTVSATATTSSIGFDGKLIGLPTQPFEWLGMSLDSAKTISQAIASGIDGGAGNDTITNNATIVASSSADADTTKVAVSFTAPLPSAAARVSQPLAIDVASDSGSNTQPPAGIDAAVFEAGTHAVATSSGISGGDGVDTLTNNGSLTASALADAYSLGVTTSISVGKGGVMSLLPSVTLVDATTKATASATGIDDGTGNDNLYQYNVLNVSSIANGTSTGVGVNFKASTDKGFAWGGTKSDTTTTALADSTGIDGGDGDDTIANSGTHAMTVTSRADADAAGVSATILGAGEGLAGGVSYADGSTTAQATSIGIDAGAGNDGITNSAKLDVSAVAESSSGNVSVSAAATKTGVSLEVALADAKTTATASATGISAGSGNDQVTSSGTTIVSSTADIASASVSVGLGFSKAGLVAGVAAADNTVTAVATATGIDGGAGDDTVTVSGMLTTTTLADVAAAGVSVEAGVAVSGVAVGGALVKGTSNANATATGVEGGSGNDTLTNSGINTAQATASVAASS